MQKNFLLLLQFDIDIPSDWLSWLFQILIIAFIMFTALYGQKFQLWVWINQIRVALLQLKQMDVQGKKIVIHMIKEINKEVDPTPKVEELRELFIIEPVDKDPYGVLKRLEHVLDVRKKKYEIDISDLVPTADPDVRANIENTLEASMSLHYIYRVVRHYYLLGKRTNNIFFIAQIQMQLPLIMKIAKSYFHALRAFADGIPIGDSIGPLVVTRLEQKYRPQSEIYERIDNLAPEIYSSHFMVNKRHVIIVRANGPGGRVGKPGEAVYKLVKKYGNKIKRIITVDAGLKLEGEKTGDVIVGVGAAIGDPGPEKYKIEYTATENGISLDAIVIKESIEEAITPMRKEIDNASEKAIEKLEHIINRFTKEGDYLIIAGIGNSSGIGLWMGDSN
ncbi:MAG: DUF1512 domain-containing protein [Candidatus Asgardarchaeum sp.]